MSQQQSGGCFGTAFVTRYSTESEQPENKTEEKKEDAQLETPSY